jgi:hypothetical protein
MSTQRSFYCPNCQGIIYIPDDLPPTTAPCPHCSGLITSPAVEIIQPAATVTHAQVVNTPVAIEQKPITSRITSADLPVEQKNSKVPWIVALVLIVGMIAGAYFLYHSFIATQISQKVSEITPTESVPGTLMPKDPSDISSTEQKMLDEEFIHSGWKEVAKVTLEKFISAKTPSEKAKYVIGGEQTLRRLLQIYGPNIMDESEFPADAFLPGDLSEENNNRNIFMMAYDRPGQFVMSKFFRPLVSIEMQHGLEELNPLIEASTKVSNFAMEPIKIHAYFKSTDQGMLLDWDVYLQTRYRTLQSFIERKTEARSGIFRVIIVEDLPLPEQEKQNVRVYRVGDPANIGDSYRIAVPIGSKVENSLKKINWQGTESIDPKLATATIELASSADETISISRFICWEYEGLGGGEAPDLEQTHKPSTLSPTGESNDFLEEPVAPDKQ